MTANTAWTSPISPPSFHATQPVAAESLALGQDSPTRRKFLARLQGEVTRRGTIDVLRKGVKHGPHQIDLMYGTPSPGNEKAHVQYAQNRFSVTRQLRYSNDNAQLALDLGLFINGLPVATFELKNSLTKQTVEDAIEQYKRDRNPREKLFELGRCLAHFAVDDHEVRFCTLLKGKESWFLPFDKGWSDGKGNPDNPNGIKTDYLWKQVLTRAGLTDIIENYAQVVESKDDKTGRKKREQIWPRYHQLDVVRRLLADASTRGVGPRYLIQHSAGSGKSNGSVCFQCLALLPVGTPNSKSKRNPWRSCTRLLAGSASAGGSLVHSAVIVISRASTGINLLEWGVGVLDGDGGERGIEREPVGGGAFELLGGLPVGAGVRQRELVPEFSELGLFGLGEDPVGHGVGHALLPAFF